MNKFDFLPGVLADIAEVAGLDAALKVAENRGGARAVFPAHARHGHWLTDLVGFESAKKICDHYRTGAGGAELLIPLGPRNMYGQARRKFRELTADGCSVEDAARQLGVHLRSARRWRQKERIERDSRQGSLF